MNGKTTNQNRFVVPREVLVVEVERRCTECQARNFIGLTKDEAREFCGFKCERCEHWCEAFLLERDAPEWWEEFQLESFDAQLSPDIAGDKLH